MMRHVREAKKHGFLARLMMLPDRQDQLRGYEPPGSFPRSETCLRMADRNMGRAIELLAASPWW